MTKEQQFWDRVEVGTEDECWSWLGAKTKGGYGTFDKTTAHRWAYRLLVGPTPEDLQVDHLCRNRACVNPAHLELVTPRENLMRGETKTAKYANATHCVHGHEFTSENTYVRSNGTRQCRRCMVRMTREQQKRLRAGPVPATRTHGRGSTYAVGCRCDECRAAVAAAARQRRSRRKAAA